MTPERRFIALGAVNAALAVALGAFGSHVLRAHLPPELLAVWQTGVQYHFYHAIGLMFAGLTLARLGDRGVIRLAGWLMLAGIALFSGVLYAYTLGGGRWLALAAPLGGGAFILAWLLLAWGALRGGPEGTRKQSTSNAGTRRRKGRSGRKTRQSFV